MPALWCRLFSALGLGIYAQVPYLRTYLESRIMKPLEALPTRLSIPPRALRHRFVTEAKIVAKVLQTSKDSTSMGVIGTGNTYRAELYGWSNPVSTHVDSATDGWIYGCILKCAPSEKIFAICPKSGVRLSFDSAPGRVFRLNEHFPHWTEGRGITLCLFVGVYGIPQDDLAIKVLSRGIARLAAGVQTAPRVSRGFRVLLDGECWATKDSENAHIIPKRYLDRGWIRLECCECGGDAVKIDHHFPYSAVHYCTKCPCAKAAA